MDDELRNLSVGIVAQMKAMEQRLDERLAEWGDRMDKRFETFERDFEDLLTQRETRINERLSDFERRLNGLKSRLP